MGQFQFPQGARYEELVYALTCNGRNRLFRAEGPICNSIDRYASVGVGLYLADYVADRMAKDSALMDTKYAELLSIYLLQQAKEYISGCGGDSHIVTLHLSSEVSIMDGVDIALVTSHMKQLDRQTALVLLSAPDLDLSEDEFESRVQIFTQFMENLRKDQQEDRKRISELRARNPLNNLFNPPDRRRI